MNIAIKTYALLIKLGRYLAPIALLTIRLGWGWELAVSGLGHLHHIDQTTAYFESLHIPMAHTNVIISACVELVGGWLLIVGLGARLISVPLFFNFCVAYLTASHDKVVNIFNFKNDGPYNFISDDAFPLLMTSLLILAVGPGLLSIDGILSRTVFKSASQNAHRGIASV